jgi:hypothetical protein
MVKVWIQRGENDPEKISISPDSDIDDLKTKVFGQINKGQYRAMYDGQILKPSDEVPQNTTDVTPVSFVKISNRTTSGKFKKFVGATILGLKCETHIPLRLFERLCYVDATMFTYLFPCLKERVIWSLNIL